MRTIYLPAIDRHVSMRAYLTAVKKAKANPDATFKHGLTCWWSCSGADIVKQFRAGMLDRISQGVPYHAR